MTCWLCGFETTAPTCKNNPCQICIQVAVVDDEINQAVATLRRLIAKRCHLRSEQNHLHGDLMHRLPVELRNYIFELAAAQDDTIPLARSNSPRIPKSSHLTSVCRSWRDIAWSTPSLWSTLPIVLGKSDPSSWIDFLRDRVRRSQTVPLTLDIVAHSKNGIDQALEGLSPLLDAYDRVWRLRISGIPIQSLQLSWNHLTSAEVKFVDLESIRQLFQYAVQMTFCHIEDPRWSDHTQAPSLPPIVHQRLKTFSLRCIKEPEVTALLLGFLTLPCLQEFLANFVYVLGRPHLPALVHRSSCPFPKIVLSKDDFVTDRGSDFRFDFRPLPGVTDLALAVLKGEGLLLAKELLLDEYLPDLCHLTIKLKAFLGLWHAGIVQKLIVLQRPQPGKPHKGKLRNIIVVAEYDRPQELNDCANVGMELKAFKELNIILRKDSFEILLIDD